MGLFGARPGTDWAGAVGSFGSRGASRIGSHKNVGAPGRQHLGTGALRDERTVPEAAPGGSRSIEHDISISS
jgi:hypothetical protein